MRLLIRSRGPGYLQDILGCSTQGLEKVRDSGSKGSFKCVALGLCRSKRYRSTWLLAAEAPVTRWGSPLPLRGRYRHTWVSPVETRKSEDLHLLEHEFVASCRETESQPTQLCKEARGLEPLFKYRTLKSRRRENWKITLSYSKRLRPGTKGQCKR